MTAPNWQALKQYRAKEAQAMGHRRSAVLIPILDVPAHSLIYTQRSHQLKHHAGQFSFPGGVVEPGETPWQAAIREANEEIGLPREHVLFLGQLDDVFSPRGFHIKCLVGLVTQFDIRLNQEEVARVITVPLAELFDACYHQTLTWKGQPVNFFHFPSGLVWGVTGQITESLRQSLDRTPRQDSTTTTYSAPKK